MKKYFAHIGAIALMFLANMATSTNTYVFFHEVECPKELLND